MLCGDLSGKGIHNRDDACPHVADHFAAQWKVAQHRKATLQKLTLKIQIEIKNIKIVLESEPQRAQGGHSCN